jgi:23S rRNA (cytidine1920-2'-O)/16S rRNA (cytidine1409-2'-O)-methyltransferase
MDVSFISIGLILPAITAIVGTGGRVVSLVKPQFEAGRGQVGKKGVVREAAVHEEVLRRVRGFAQTLGWQAQALTHSPVTGPEGNIEFLIDLVPVPAAQADLNDEAIVQAVAAAHAELR